MRTFWIVASFVMFLVGFAMLQCSSRKLSFPSTDDMQATFTGWCCLIVAAFCVGIASGRKEAR